MKQILITLALSMTAFSWPTHVAAQDIDAVSKLYRDRSAAREEFLLPTMSGNVKFKPAYSRTATQPLAVYIVLKVPARLNCMSALDWAFSLHNEQGQRITGASAAALNGHGVPLPTVVQMWHVAATPGLYAGCPYGPRADALFGFSVQTLYPHLPAGTYRLQMIFRPRDGSVPATRLPPITFTIR